jgi:hypothetical protein
VRSLAILNKIIIYVAFLKKDFQQIFSGRFGYFNPENRPGHGKIYQTIKNLLFYRLIKKQI